MKKINKLFQIFMIVFASLTLASCVEDTAMDELMDSIDKYELSDAADEGSQNNTPPPPGGD